MDANYLKPLNKMMKDQRKKTTECRQLNIFKDKNQSCKETANCRRGKKQQAHAEGERAKSKNLF